jgi:hypothetical protein
MGKLVITTLDLAEAKALLKELPPPSNANTDEYLAAYAKLSRAIQHAERKPQ